MQRLIDLDGCLNFRDLGGYPTTDHRQVRWRRVFRADALHLLTPRDLDRLVEDLQLQHVIDLRSTAERKADPERPLDQCDALEIHHLPLYDGERSERPGGSLEEMSLAQRYMGLLDIAQSRVARILEILSEAEGACVYHCAAGKDRTGVVSAVLLGVLDVEPRVIIADYAATQENLDQIIERLLETRGYDTVLDPLPADTLHARPETMRELLEGLARTYGSAMDYARASGVHASTLERLRANLLENG